MVFFNCNGCGEAMKKNQVEKHAYRCRQCFVVSCVDCGKDFRGNDYQMHTKCMTEAEKYCGKGYVPKVNKGEAKQEQWIENVQAAIAKSNSKPSLQRLLERMQDYPNIPRKKGKFENFLKNSLRVSNPSLISDVWTVLMEAAPVKTTQNTQQKATDIPQVTETTPTVSVKDSADVQSMSEEKLSQKEGENKKEKNGDVSTAIGEKTDKATKPQEDENGDTTTDSKIKGKRRKNATIENGDILDGELGSKKKKRKKEKTSNADPLEEVTNGLHEENGHTEINGAHDNVEKASFDLKATIKGIVKQKEDISIKKLRKKVLREFQAHSAFSYTQEQLLANFDKKISTMKKLKVHDGRVMLKAVFRAKYEDS